ncbi:MAG: hypothetical protein BA872_06225 [Desulfobacterales bacterium C00003060]|nr:MAG: hypothetical protein BA872_06225 [Desulfobacterales bacterium C00003060]OEU84871.1 MAG: hypothetical protein BA865_06235 [Desulfobacterales bacterium S5133MH4]
MVKKPTCEELEQRVKELEKKSIERKRAEEALRESQDRYKELWDHAPVAYHMLDSEGIITQVNQTERKMLGYTEDEMVGRPIFTFILAEQRKEAEKRFRLKLEGKRIPKQDNRIYLKKNGSKIHVSIDDVLEYDNDGNVVGVRSTMVDISDQQRAAEALKESSERIKLFAYSVSHDLKSPAVAVYGLTRLLHEHYGDSLDERAKNYCEQIMTSVEQIGALVENINVYISSKEVPLSIEKVRLREVLDMIKDEFSAQLSIRQIRWSQPESFAEIRADRLSIVRVLRNLVDNALKYGGDDLSEIRIEHKASDEFDTLSVSNDGVLIRRSDSEDIFGPFQRHKTSRGVQGSGLGLAIVKEIAEQHEGRVWVGSDSKKWSTFYVSISRHL